MAEKNFQTRIQLKYDTWANWNTTTAKAIVLKKGELAVVEVPAAAGAVVQEPAILFKVGDGSTAFSSLPWASAKAADVYDWAKASTKPTYSASEVTGLTEFVQNISDIDTDTQYKIVAVTSSGVTTGYKLQSKGLTDSSWTDVSGSTIDIQTDAEINALIDTKLTAQSFGNIITHDVDEFATATQGATADAAMPKAGGTFTGAITLSGAPTSNLHAATKKYVDDGLANKQDSLSFEGTYNSSTNKVATKSYVDSQIGGLGKAMRFIGRATVAITDGGTENPTITGYDFTNDAAAGDVVLGKEDNKEYVWTGSAWEELGKEGSWATSDHNHDSAYVAKNGTDRLITVLEATKLAGIAEGAEVNVQADWNQTTTTADDYIKNKPEALKNPNALTFGSKTYDGSTALEITAEDLGAVTASSLTLATVATTGNVEDLIQDSGDVLVFQCGSSTTNV